jgi:predicted RNA-binding Zn ribbon-like protein
MRKRFILAAGFSIDDPGHRRFRQIQQLKVLAERLNENYKLAIGYLYPELRETYDAYNIVKKIVSSDSLPHAAELFNTHAAAHPIKLQVGVGRMRDSGEEHASPALSTQNEFESSLDLLWRSYFYEKGWKRLKSCPVCHKWFVDPTNDMRKARCSVACTNLWWSYSKRKEADYSRFKKGGYHGRKKHR